MKIFICHSTKSNFEEELYIPLQNSELNEKHELVFPHEGGTEMQVKDIIRDCDLVLAEVSDPTFEQGLELGWASGAYVTTICFYKSSIEVSPLISQVSDSINVYGSIEEMVKKVEEAADAL